MKYVLSANAQKSLIQIKGYTAENFGNKQAKSYLKKLQQQFALICQTPELGISRDDIEIGYRCRFIASHTIYYRIRSETIEIIDVLHQSMEPLHILLENIDGKNKS